MGFAKQTIHNACATQAILSILLNRAKDIDLGPTLSNFLEFTQSLDPESIGIALSNQDEIRIAHNSFSRAEPIQIEKAKDDEEGEAFHFISYVPVNGILYEIDGLQKGPRLIDGCDENNWFEKAARVLRQRMASYQSKELRFTLLSICKDLKVKYVNERRLLVNKKENKAMDVDDASEYISNFPVDQIDERLSALDELIKNEEMKRVKWKNENIRRRHNYFPFILNLIGILGKQKVLRSLTERAKEKKKEKIQRMEDEKKKREEADKKKEAEKTDDKASDSCAK